MYCSFCGLKIPNESKFCEHCGRDLNTGQLKDTVKSSVNQIGIDNLEDKKVFLIPTGAILSLICFFLPWVRFSCSGKVKNASGADLGGVFWLVFIAAVFIIFIFFIFNNKKELAKSKPFIIFSSIIAFVVLLIQYIRFSSGSETEFGRIRPEDIGFTIQFGGIGTLIGFFLTFFGSFFIKKRNVNNNPSAPDN